MKKYFNRLPNDWNKRFICIKYAKRTKGIFKKNGYIWPTNNWIEVHIFNYKREILNNEYYIVDNSPYTQNNTLRRNVYRIKKIIFEGRIKSFITKREHVLFSAPDIIYYIPVKEDFQRWKKWHPNDNFITYFEKKVWHFGQKSHGGFYVYDFIDSDDATIIAELKI